MPTKQVRLLTLLLLLTSSQNFAKPSYKIARPKLVVGIVIDQMRWDFLYRYYERYSKDGFRRLMEQGYNCQNTKLNYVPTFTAPGHASIYTGSVPAFHGIVANNWFDARNNTYRYCTEDSTVTSVGGGKNGLMSPRNMLATTITDELRLATNFRSRTIGISLKDRGSILPAGHTATAAYWYDGENGNFIASSFYMHKLPQWLQDFNARNITDSLMKLNWHTLYPLSTYVQSTADDNLYEGNKKYSRKPIFPHITAAIKDEDAIRRAPQGNTLTRMMAEACITNEGLGKGEVTDFLALSFSSTDYVGHDYGPNSIEVEDTYLRMDKELALFLSFLDKQIGKDNYTIFLTADHGAAHNATFLQDQRIPAKSVSIKEVNQLLNRFLDTKYADSSLVRSLINYQVFFNEKIIKDKRLDRDALKLDIMNWLKAQDGVTNVLDLEHLDKSIVPEPLRAMVTNGYYPNRCGSIQIILDPGWYSGYGNTGTSHGNWNPYDVHVPLLWYGWGIKKGETFKTTNITDIAATLAALLHIQVPNACIGEVIEEVMK